MMKPKLHSLGPWRGAFLAGLVYVALLISAWLANLSSPSGPCTPGLRVMLFFLLPIVNILWLIVDVFKSVRARNIQLEIITHTIVLLTWMSLLVKG
jgi:hypothetical protein